VIVTIQPSAISGIIKAPASKSSMQRACAAALLSKGSSIIHNPGHSNDDKAAIEIIKNLGARTEMIDEKMIVDSEGILPVVDKINCSESGLSIRMFTPLASLSDKEISITGEGSLLNRPMNFFDEILPQLGVTVHSNNGKLPIKIKGPMQPGNIEIDGSLSSQFLTGLLMAYSAAGARDVSIRVNNLKSKPYIDLTLEVMKQFAMKLPENKNYKEFYFSHKNAETRQALSLQDTMIYSFTLSTYSPVLVLMRMSSPSFTNKGTFTVAPVSIVAGLSVRVAVSPLIPGSL